jgi:hypothetical protein
VNTRFRADTLLRMALIAGLPVAACSPAATAPPGPPRTDGGGTSDAASGADAVSPALANMVGCKHLKDGPFSPVTPKTMSTYIDPGPPIDNTAKAFRLTMPAPPRTGHVSFKVPSNGDWVIFTSRSLPITVFTWDGTALTPKSVASTVPECTEVKSREVYELATDSKPHVIRFGGDSADPVDVVLSSTNP